MWKVTDALISHKLEHSTVRHSVGVFVGQLEQHGVSDIKAAWGEGRKKVSFVKSPQNTSEAFRAQTSPREWARLEERIPFTPLFQLLTTTEEADTQLQHWHHTQNFKCSGSPTLQMSVLEGRQDPLILILKIPSKCIFKLITLPVSIQDLNR